TVVSHLKALEQCQKFFNQHSWISSQVVSDTANGALMVAEKNDPSLAAIASQEAAKMYDLHILIKNLEDDPENYTRFVIVEHRSSAQENGNKASVLLTLKHRPGALAK